MGGCLYANREGESIFYFCIYQIKYLRINFLKVQN